MGKKLYGVDLSKKVTPVMVRDAIIICFTQAHSEVLDQIREYGKSKSKEDAERMKRAEVTQLVKTKFNDVGGDFDNPTKEDLEKVVWKLARFAAEFRKEEVISKHRSEIMKLIGKLK